MAHVPAWSRRHHGPPLGRQHLPDMAPHTATSPTTGTLHHTPCPSTAARPNTRTTFRLPDTGGTSDNKGTAARQELCTHNNIPGPNKLLHHRQHRQHRQKKDRWPTRKTQHQTAPEKHRLERLLYKIRTQKPTHYSRQPPSPPTRRHAHQLRGFPPGKIPQRNTRLPTGTSARIRNSKQPHHLPMHRRPPLQTLKHKHTH